MEDHEIKNETIRAVRRRRSKGHTFVKLREQFPELSQRQIRDIIDRHIIEHIESVEE